MEKIVFSIFTIVLLLLSGLLVSPVSSDIIETTAIGTTLYVGGTGPGNYSKIQDAIDNASDGDTVYVYNGTYFENIDLQKSIDLVGESKENTIIDGKGYLRCIDIETDYIKIEKFTFINSSTGIVVSSAFENIAINDNILSDLNTSLLIIDSKNVTVKNNLIQNNNDDGICISGGECIIENNIIRDNQNNGIFLRGNGYQVNIKNNTICNNTNGISVGIEYVIERNSIYNNEIGIYFRTDSYGAYNTIRYNQIINNEFGFKSGTPIQELGDVFEFHTVNFQNNNLIDNRENKFHVKNGGIFKNWNNNYWDDWDGRGPYRIKGTPCIIYRKDCGFAWSFSFNFDWNPASEPYDIDTGWEVD